MPIYDFECGVCGYINTLIRPIKERNDLVLCEKCGCVAHRIFLPSSIKFAEQKGYYSDTMGCHPDQVADEKLRHPSWKFNKKGQLWINNLADQRKKAKVLGMQCLDDICG